MDVAVVFQRVSSVFVLQNSNACLKSPLLDLWTFWIQTDYCKRWPKESFDPVAAWTVFCVFRSGATQWKKSSKKVSMYSRSDTSIQELGSRFTYIKIFFSETLLNRSDFSKWLSKLLSLTSLTLEYLITEQHLLNVHRWKTRFHMTCKEGQFDVVELMVNDHLHINGMTPFDLAVHSAN